MLSKEEIKELIIEVEKELLIKHTREIISNSIEIETDEINKNIDDVFKELISKDIDSNNSIDENTINWLPLYTASYLQKTLNKNYNSIKKQSIAVEYKWRYILHEDIIKQFILSLT